MAQFFNDFTQYTLDTFPSDWLAFTEATGGGVVDERHLRVLDLGTEAVGSGRGLKFDSGAETGNYIRAYIWDAIASGADFEVYYRFQITASFYSEVQGAVRQDFSGGVLNWYQGGPRSGDDLDLNKYISGSFSNLANDTSKDWVNENNWQLCRFQVSGSTLKVKIWDDGSSEPAGWDVTDTDTDLTSGKVGIVTYRDRVFYVSNFGVGTNGDTAPNSAPVTGPNTPINPSITNLLATSARLNWEQG